MSEIPRRVRFEVFKRDRFACQYCGQTPPAVTLEVDHIVARAEGGSNDFQNLITACFDCNRGKGAIPLSDRMTPEETEGQRERVRERIEQAQAYEGMLREIREAEDAAIDRVIAVYEAFFDGWTIAERVRPSIRRFLRGLPEMEVVEAMEIACARTNSKRAFQYFCGVCWRKIEQRGAE